MPKNFLPFARRQDITVPAITGGIPGRISTRLGDFATGNCIKAHLVDCVMFQGTDTSTGDSLTNEAKLIKMRMAISGNNYFTEDLYDYRCYRDGHRPLVSVWKWGGYPYRIYPGQRIRVAAGPGISTVQVLSDVRSIMFNCVRVDNGRPILLYDAKYGEDTTVTDLVELDGPFIECPGDTPVDVYSVTTAENSQSSILSTQINIWGPDERPWWNGRAWQHIIDPPTAPILLGKGWGLEPDQQITFEFENHDTAEAMVIIVRGVLEVEQEVTEQNYRWSEGRIVSAW